MATTGVPARLFQPPPISAQEPHTYTQRAHNTHSPARLPLPLGRHPGLLPFGNSAFSTPHHSTPHHTTSHHTPGAKPTRKGPGTTLGQCTDSVGCKHAPVLSTSPGILCPP